MPVVITPRVTAMCPSSLEMLLKYAHRPKSWPPNCFLGYSWKRDSSFQEEEAEFFFAFLVSSSFTLSPSETPAVSCT